jgi:hypothetical protein
VLRALGADTVSLFGSVAALPETATEQDLRAVFHEPEVTFLHIAEDAAALLHARTAGSRPAVAAELERWVRAGRGRWAGDVFLMERAAVDRLRWEGDPELSWLVSGSRDLDVTDAEFARMAVERARELHARGRATRAASLLEGALQRLTGEEPVRTVLEELVCAALAVGEVDRVRHAMHRAQLAGAADLVALLQGAAMARRGEAARAVAALATPFASRDLELERLAKLGQAHFYGDPAALERVLADAQACVRGEPVAEGRWWILRGTAAYARGAFREALDAHLTANELLVDVPVWRLSALTNGGAAALEVPELQTALSMAQEAGTVARSLRHGLAEGRAAWLERTAAFRRGDPLSCSTGLVDAAAQVSGPLAAQTAITEGAIALASGDVQAMAEFGRLAAFTYSAGNPHVRAFGLAMAGQRAAADAKPGALDPPVRLQVEAILAATGVGPRPAPADVQAWRRTWPLRDPSQRLDVLSLDECTAHLTRRGRARPQKSKSTPSSRS